MQELGFFPDLCLNKKISSSMETVNNRRNLLRT